MADVRVEGSNYLISLVELVGKPIKDIHGYLTGEFGDPVFKMTKIVFEDGIELGCEGEHDCPYLVQYGRKSSGDYTTEVLDSLYNENG